MKVVCILSNACEKWKQDGEIKPILCRRFLFYRYLFNHFPPILYALLKFLELVQCFSTKIQFTLPLPRLSDEVTSNSCRIIQNAAPSAVLPLSVRSGPLLPSSLSAEFGLMTSVFPNSSRRPWKYAHESMARQL